ncbi:M4 family metallopeptidase [Legionella sp. CNM-4043-24]|uniref:M4 family metallopeptidase n=1 Tax=Legionella sp. CNM-4043-24 TaxID=3421646 RepID=UPI00403A8BDD
MSRQLAIFGTMAFALPVVAATPVNLATQSPTFLASQSLTSPGVQLKETSRRSDAKNTLHVRVQQEYRGYPVWGGDSIVHIPDAGRSAQAFASIVNAKTFMNGIVYQGLNKDLDSAPNTVFTDGQRELALAHVLSLKPELKGHRAQIRHEKIELMVFVDDADKAHWAYKVSYHVLPSANIKRQTPTMLIDAVDFTVYESWDDLKSYGTPGELVNAGGFGGNHKTGKKAFDGLPGHLPWLTMTRFEQSNICRMANEHVFLTNVSASSPKPMQFRCEKTDPRHNHIYWNGQHDKVETTWSPSNDVMFGAEVTRQMFNEWYHMPMLTQHGKPMRLEAEVHSPDENAYWFNNKVMFGDSLGSEDLNPFTQLDTVAHEINHGFTEQHSNLRYRSQSGGLNEAFSDIAGIAAEFYAYGSTNFLVGLGDVKAKDKALRYMDQPSKDCEGREPGYYCSIDTFSQYYEGLNVHYSSGLFNRVYYLLAHTPGWDAKKAFDVMVEANINHWRSSTSFSEAACGVARAADTLEYNVADVRQAFDTVGIPVCEF